MQQDQNRRTWKQCKIVFHKNLLVYIKEKAYIGEFSAPLIVFILLLAAKSSDTSELQQSAAPFLPMCLLIITRSVVTTMITEKSERQKETQKIMGLKPLAYEYGWSLSNYLRFFCVLTFFLLLVVPTGVMNQPENTPNSLTTLQIVIGFILYGLASLQLCYVIAAIFQVPKTGADVAVFMSVVGSLSSQILQIEYVREHSFLIILLSVHFPSFCYNVYPYAQVLQLQYPIEFSKQEYFLILGLDVVLFGILALYLNQVVPNEYGTHKHPLFFLGVKFKNSQNKKYAQGQNQMVEPLNEEQLEGDYSTAVFHEPIKNKNMKRAIQIEDLTKSFGSTRAVDKISLQIYDSQILCLLGHNGAGKTTTISLLTGLLTKDSGVIKFYGSSTDQNLDYIRSFTGMCPQKDVLYDCLTVVQHLEYYGRIKGLSEYELENNIEEVIEKCALQTERTKISKTLSGGNKRKLSLAMALIGGSKVIFLDEPTSGMDPVTRRKIWQILLQMKEDGKCLILTTHHLEEAEVLSERIAIMAKGKLLTVGSNDFVKKNFGIGYHLNIYNLNNENWNNKRQYINQLVTSKIIESKQEPQTANEFISFQVPFDCKEKLCHIFNVLENDPSIQINLMMNTLEEAFINIGMDEEAFLKKAQGIVDQINNDHDQDTNINLNDEFAKIIPPECLKRDPIYSFVLQFKACFLRKVYGMKSKQLLTQLIIPSTFCFAGPFIGKLTKSSFDFEPDPQDPNKVLSSWYTYGLSVYVCAYIEVVIGMAIASTNQGCIPVQERQLKQKYALNVMGCRAIPYWIANFVFDGFVASILFFIYTLTVLIFQIEPLNYFVVYILFLQCFIAYISLSYLLSWLFSDFQLALRFLMIIQIFAFYMPGFLLFILVKSVALKWILTITFPCVTLLSGLFATLDKNYNSTFLNEEIIFIENAWISVIILFFQTILLLLLSIAIDYRKLLSVQSEANIVESRDNDVLEESKRIASNSCQDKVIVRKISKVYANGFSALKGTSFGVDSGQIFGLLGPNGAGKSTTFNMITCRLKPTAGQIYLMGQQTEKGKGEIFQNVGVCPQFDSLFELITVKQHLEIWANLKGLKDAEVSLSVNYFMKVMQLTDYENTQADKLSGGNKRKLCVALALMGGTNIQFFDEPSSGVDPIARRFLWNAIQNGVKLRNGAVILTTHTMDEAESLCSKIAIQINGQFSCLGTPQHLKQKFGEGYRVTLELVEGIQSTLVIEQINRAFPNSQVLEESQNKVIVQLNKHNFSFYRTFTFFLETLQKNLKYIIDFQINQATLESVFMHFASQQQLNETQVLQKKKFVIACCGNDEDD